jgi:MOSC domain-containing protein YiiM
VRVAALFIGVPRSVAAHGSSLYTGGAKAPAAAARLTFEGFEGDGQGNLRHHGGRDRTACVYPAEHYSWWKSQGLDLSFGAFCENLTVEGAQEEKLCIGDIFRAGGALVQISLPRDPCPTIDHLCGVPGLHVQARGTGKCGFHMRTLEEGEIRSGDVFELVRRHVQAITVASVLDLYHGRSRDPQLALRLQGMPEFAAQGKADIARALTGS